MLLELCYNSKEVLPDLVSITLCNKFPLLSDICSTIFSALNVGVYNYIVPHVSANLDFEYYRQVKNVMHLIQRYDSITPYSPNTYMLHIVNNSKHSTCMYLHGMVFNNVHIILPALIYFIYSCINNIELVLRGFFYWLYFMLELLFHLFGINTKFIYNVICTILIKSKPLLYSIFKLILLILSKYWFLFIVLLINKPTLAENSSQAHTVFTIRRIIAGVGTLGFILSNTIYDYLYRQYVNTDRGLTTSYNLYRLLIGFVFTLNIFIGVSSSTEFWFVTFSNKTWLNIIGVIGSAIISYLSSTIWIWLARLSIKGYNAQYTIGIRPTLLNRISHFLVDKKLFISFLRSLAEATNFTFLSWFSFSLWHYWSSTNLEHINIISFVVGLLVYTPSALLSVFSEQYFKYIKYYGIFYILSFSSLSFLTNGLIFIWIYEVNHNILLINLCIGVILALIFPLEIYRVNNALQNPRLIDVILNPRSVIRIIGAMFYFLISFYAFASFTYIIYLLYLPLWFT